MRESHSGVILKTHTGSGRCECHVDGAVQEWVGQTQGCPSRAAADSVAGQAARVQALHRDDAVSVDLHPDSNGGSLLAVVRDCSPGPDPHLVLYLAATAYASDLSVPILSFALVYRTAGGASQASRCLATLVSSMNVLCWACMDGHRTQLDTLTVA